MIEPSDTMLILATIKYAVSKDGGHCAIVTNHLTTIVRDAKWNGKRFELSTKQRAELQEEVPPAYWIGAINDSL